MLDLSRSTRKTAWFAKDQAKARRATKFIGRGSPASSTDAYRRALLSVANRGSYSADDIVFVSAEGARRDRLDPDFTELRIATTAKARFITDGPADRDRSYNCSERAIASFLRASGYTETSPGLWEPPA